MAERDGAWCLVCGRTGAGLHLHRVTYGSQGGGYEAGNCVFLCAEHHRIVHSSKAEWKPLLDRHLRGERVGYELRRKLGERSW